MKKLSIVGRDSPAVRHESLRNPCCPRNPDRFRVTADLGESFVRQAVLMKDGRSLRTLQALRIAPRLPAPLLREHLAARSR